VVLTVKVIAGALGAAVELTWVIPEAEALRNKMAQINVDATNSPAKRKLLFIESPTLRRALVMVKPRMVSLHL
jgi:hypothetical protein